MWLRSISKLQLPLGPGGGGVDIDIRLLVNLRG